jgi:hypothetical protein
MFGHICMYICGKERTWANQVYKLFHSHTERKKQRNGSSVLLEPLEVWMAGHRGTSNPKSNHEIHVRLKNIFPFICAASNSSCPLPYPSYLLSPPSWQTIFYAALFESSSEFAFHSDTHGSNPPTLMIRSNEPMVRFGNTLKLLGSCTCCHVVRPMQQHGRLVPHIFFYFWPACMAPLGSSAVSAHCAVLYLYTVV